MGGVVKGYARLIETDVPGSPRHEVRDSRIDRSIWRRIVAENKTADVFGVGSVHLDGPVAGQRISVIGVRFDQASVASAAQDHGQVPPAPIPAAPAKVVRGARATKKPAPKAEQASLPLDEDGGPDVVATDAEADAPIPKTAARPVLDPNTVALSKDETAAILGVSLGTVNNMIGRGELVVKKIGRRVLVQADSVRALMS
jgi:excisionase family DNA binding protein